MTPQSQSIMSLCINFGALLKKSLTQSRLAEKYRALVTKALFSNSVEALGCI